MLSNVQIFIPFCKANGEKGEYDWQTLRVCLPLRMVIALYYYTSEK
jgi:hypothetical protein